MDMFDSFVRELFADCHDVRVREECVVEIGGHLS